MSSPICWCGNSQLDRFSEDYFLCPVCQTLITARPPAQAHPHVHDDEADFYGKNYWFKHQEQDLGFANIQSRARTDLSERCQHWLATLLRYKLPPAKILELGCAHGGFVAMLRAARFDAAGLELSPAIVEFARRTFDVPMYQGPIEEQAIEPGSLDVIAMMDVMEHLPDPVGTMRKCAQLLAPDGVLIAQTPRVPVGRTFADMVANDDAFLEQFKSEEHLYLYSEQSAAELFRRVGLEYLALEPAMFARYDMFLFAGRLPLKPRTEEAVEQALLESPRGRMVLSWLDMDRQQRKLRSALEEMEADHRRRLADIGTLTAQVRQLTVAGEQIEAERQNHLQQIQTLTDQVHELQVKNERLETDRIDHLQQIETLTAQLRELQAVRSTIELDRAAHLAQISALTDRVHELESQNLAIERDRAARLEHILTLTARIKELTAVNEQIEADRADRLEQIHALTAQVRGL